MNEEKLRKLLRVMAECYFRFLLIIIALNILILVGALTVGMGRGILMLLSVLFLMFFHQYLHLLVVFLTLVAVVLVAGEVAAGNSILFYFKSSFLFLFAIARLWVMAIS